MAAKGTAHRSLSASVSRGAQSSAAACGGGSTTTVDEEGTQDLRPGRNRQPPRQIDRGATELLQAESFGHSGS